jgi:hypothetical protein
MSKIIKHPINHLLIYACVKIAGKINGLFAGHCPFHPIHPSKHPPVWKLPTCRGLPNPVSSYFRCAIFFINARRISPKFSDHLTQTLLL